MSLNLAAVWIAVFALVGIGKNSTEHGHMTVTSLKMVSNGCS